MMIRWTAAAACYAGERQYFARVEAGAPSTGDRQRGNETLDIAAQWLAFARADLHNAIVISSNGRVRAIRN